MARLRPSACGALLLLVAAAPRAGYAESPACAQARSIVAEVEGLWQAGDPDHVALLRKLTTARDLCSALGSAWRLSFCSARALGDEAAARRFRDRALFNGEREMTCPAAGGATAPAPERPLPGTVRRKFALVVGIGRFADPRIPTLRFAAKDARDVAHLLTDPGVGRFDPADVTLLNDAAATRAGILDALQRIAVQAQEDDLVLLYVSSHGSPRRGRDLSGVGYIVTYDTAVDRVWVDGLDYEGFSRLASRIRARRKVVFLDTCYSGQAEGAGGKALVLEGSGVGADTARLFLSGEGTYVITSSRAEEASFESESLGNSYFTHFLVEALGRRDAPPIGRVFEQVSSEVAAAVARDKGMPQHPQMVPEKTAGDLRIGVATLAGPPP